MHMGKHYKRRTVLLVCVMVIVFAAVAGLGVRFSSGYVERQLLFANKNDAVDIAKLINNNFSITDKEVQYLKSLTFNEMERDPINSRLMDTVEGLVLNDTISNVYVLVPLSEEEIRYTTDEKTAEFFDCEVGTKLNGMWLMNGKFDEKGNFLVATREDIYRYLELCSSDIQVFESKKSFGLVSKDAWGKFITGYTPLYSAEGTFIGILGVDMDINQYNTKVSRLTTAIFIAFGAITLALITLFLIFFVKYMKTKESALYYDFYSRLSHDMRTPMNGILGIAELSKDEQDSQVLQENIGKMEESGKYLLGLINDTLDLHKIQNKKLKLNLDVVDSRVLVKDIANMVTETARKKGVQFTLKVMTTDTDDYIRADGLRLKQIFINLLSNAVKFTPEGGTVEWLIDVPSRDGKTAHNIFTIRDTGIGMSEKFIRHNLFKPFSQEYNVTTSQYAGSGLGLSIVKSLVEQMGGRIEVESEKGDGTTFTVFLDFEKVESREAEKILDSRSIKKEISTNVLKGRQILLAEDHPLNAEIARRLLEKQGCIVTWMDNGEKVVRAFAQSEKDTFDAILMDIRMPVMDGMKAAKEIRCLDREDAKTIPIIAMTANAYEEDVKQSYEAGMNTHLAKPVDPKMLYDSLASFFHKEK